MIIKVRRSDAGLQHIWVDKCLTNAVRIFTLLFEVILGFSRVAYNHGYKSALNICMEQKK